MRVLCLLTLPVTWKVGSSLNTRPSSKSVFFQHHHTNIWIQKPSRTDLSVSFKCSLQGIICRRFFTTRQTVVEAIGSSRLALLIDFLGLHWKMFSNSFSGALTFLNFACHLARRSGGCFENSVRNLR